MDLKNVKRPMYLAFSSNGVDNYYSVIFVFAPRTVAHHQWINYGSDPYLEVVGICFTSWLLLARINFSNGTISFREITTR